MGKSHGGEIADLICGRAVEWGCVYASDRRAERYEPDRGITDSLPGVCSLGDCRMVDLTAGIVGAGTVWMCIDVCSDCTGTDTDAGEEIIKKIKFIMSVEENRKSISQHSFLFNLN